MYFKLEAKNQIKIRRRWGSSCWQTSILTLLRENDLKGWGLDVQPSDFDRLRLRCIYCAKNINPQSMIVKNTLLEPRGLDGFVDDGTFHWERNSTPNANLYFNVCIKWRITINGSSITFRIQGIGMNRISTTKFSLVERLTDRLKTALKEIRRTFRCNSPQHPALFKENSIKER